MRFIVDFFRYVILAGIAIAIIFIVMLGLQLATNADTESQGAYFFYIAGSFLFVSVMMLGSIAIFISIHDRHAEIVDELRALRHSLQKTDDGEQE